MSPHHYPKSVYEASYFCKTCMRLTMHIVANNRLGPCKEHAPKEKPAVEKKKESMNLFEEK